MIKITRKHSNLNDVNYSMRVYYASACDKTKKEHVSNNLESDREHGHNVTDNQTNSVVSLDFVKTNINKAIYFTSTTLNRLYLRENFIEKLNNSVSASRNYINETLSNAIPGSKNESNINSKIKNTIEKLDSNKNEVVGSSSKKAENLNPGSINSITIPKTKLKTNEIVTLNRLIEDQTRFLCKSIKKSSSSLIKTLYVEALSKHLYENIEMRNIVFEEGIDKHLVELKKQENQEKRLIGHIKECLALLGVIDLERNRGINVLSIDGGGAKGFVAIEVLKHIEQKTGKRIHEVFDYIIGTSTGAILACLIGIYKITLNDCENYYKKFVKEIFARNTAAGISNLLMTQSWYDSKLLTQMLREAMGEKLIIHSARELDGPTPKISVVSNVTTPNNMKVFLFRNYNLSLDQQSHYDGTHKHTVWQAARASSAAPGYYEDFKIDGYIFHDGGVLANNPTGIALHEAKQLWPSEELQCVISIGNGRFQPVEYLNKCDSLSIKQKVNRIVGGATSTESVHTLLNDLMQPKVYFRFNPYMSEEFHLDENRPEKWQVMQHDTQQYVRRNNYKFEMASKQLLRKKSPLQKINGYIKQTLNSVVKSY